MEGLASLTRLRKLNLSFNKIQKIEGIANLLVLEYLELGKNFISDVSTLLSQGNRLTCLSELYLYSNQLSSLPRDFSFPQLKILNLNRN